MEKNLEKIQEKLELITRKWWFLVLFILIGTMTPPIATKGFDFSKIGMIIPHILQRALITTLPVFVYTIFKILPVILIVLLIFLKNRIGRIFSFYGGITYLLFTFLQSIAITDKYGLGIVTGNFILMLIIAFLWFWEVIVYKNDFSSQETPIIRYWVVPLAFLAFLYPVNLKTMKPDFSFIQFFTNPAGLAFCTMTPVYLGILTLYYPKVNFVTLRTTSLLGIIIGFWNIIVNFIIKPEILWWNGVLHLPLVFISIYALILSFRKIQPVETTKVIK